MGFQINDPFISLSTHTRYSLPSMFNFNLHTTNRMKTLEKDSKLRTADEDMIYLFENNLLIDSLNEKNIKSYSYGMLKFNNSDLVNNNYNTPWTKFDNIHFLENFPLLNSIFKHTAFDYFNKFIKNKIYDRFKI